MGKNGFYVLCIIVLLIGLWLISPVIADTHIDSTGWKFRSDNNNSGIYDDGGKRPQGTEIWTYKTELGVFSSPAVADGVVYVGSSDGNVYALNAATGAHIWAYTTGSHVGSSPAVANGVLYVGSSDGNVYALNAATGTQIWNFITGYLVTSSPAVADGIVYVGSWDHNVYALNAATGALLWNYTTEDLLYSSPAVVNGVVYVGSNDHNVYALNAATGTQIWNFITGYPVTSSPAVSNGIVYVGSGDNKLYALNAATGAHIWTYTTGGWVYSSPAVADGVVYVGSNDKNVYAFNAATGALIWTYTTGSQVGSSPAVANGVLYVGSDDGNVYALGSFPDNTTNLLVGKLAPQFQQNASVMDYTLSYRNQGSITAENVVLKDILPNNVEYISATGNPTYDSVKRELTWNLGNIPKYTTGTNSITINIPSSTPLGSVLNNTANITTTTKEVWYHDNTAWTLTTVIGGILPPNVTLTPYTPSSDGIPSVYYQDQVNFSYHSCPNATGVDIRIHINDGKSDITGSMTGGPPDWHYATTFYPRYGDATITYSIHGCESQNVTFPIYIDPAGYIYDTYSGERIPGANVWLQRPNENGIWTNVPTGLNPPPMQPDQNPQITNAEGQYQWDVLEGSYRVYVEAEGYKPTASTMVNIPPPVFDLNVGLEPNSVPTTGSISVNSIPSGAQIFLEGGRTDFITPHVLTGISAGQHTVMLKLAGYQDYNETVSVTAGHTTTVAAVLSPVTTTGNISVSSIPSGAQIYLDGSSIGQITPYTLTGISTGQHTVLLKLAGYQDYTQPLTVTTGQTTSVNITLYSVLPVAVFTASPLTGSYPLTVHFVDNSTGTPPLTYQWSFGDSGPSSNEQNPFHIYQAAGTFYVNLTVANNAGNNTLARPNYINVTAPQPSDYNLNLGEGWNMVSVPKKLAPGYDTGSIFKNVTTEGRTIWEYDGVIHDWVPIYADTPVLPLYGLWVYSKYPTTVPLTFETNVIQIPPSRNLVQGWNLIGFSGTIPASARDTLISVQNTWTQAMGFDTPVYQYGVQIINGGSGQFSDSRLMHPTKGYWLFMTGPGDLSAIGV